jgi:hypothetical protein
MHRYARLHVTGGLLLPQHAALHVRQIQNRISDTCNRCGPLTTFPLLLLGYWGKLKLNEIKAAQTAL